MTAYERQHDWLEESYYWSRDLERLLLARLSAHYTADNWSLLGMVRVGLYALAQEEALFPRGAVSKPQYGIPGPDGVVTTTSWSKDGATHVRTVSEWPVEGLAKVLWPRYYGFWRELPKGGDHVASLPDPD